MPSVLCPDDRLRGVGGLFLTIAIALACCCYFNKRASSMSSAILYSKPEETEEDSPMTFSMKE